MTLALGPGRRPADDLGDGRPRGDLAVDHARLPDDRAAPAGRPPRARRRARSTATRRVPALVSEADLFLRLCPAPTIGVTGTKGKTTTSVADRRDPRRRPAHPVVLGGNIGAADRRAPARADARPPRRRRAVRAPAADPVARHDRGGLHQRHLGPSRPARDRSRAIAGSSAGWPSWSTPTVRSCSTPRTRSSRRTPRLGRRALDPVPARRAAAGRARRRRRLDRRRPGRAPRPGGWRWIGDLGRRADHADRRAGHPGRAQRVERAGGGRGRARSSGVAPAAIRAAAAAFSGVEHRLETVAAGRRRPLRQRLAGHPARRGGRRAARVRAAGRAHRRRPRQGHRPVGARPGRGRTRDRGGPHRRERPGPRGGASGRPAWPAPSARPISTRPFGGPTRSPGTRSRTRRAGAGPATVLLSPAAASFDMFVDYAARGRAFKACRRRARREQSRRRGPMNLAPPIPRLERPAPAGCAGAPAHDRGDRQPDAGQEPRRGAPTRAPPGRLRDPRGRRRADRDRDPDGLLVVGAEGLPVAGRRHVRDGRAADPVGDPGLRRDGGHDAGRLPLPAARLGAVLSSSRSSCSCSSSCPQLNIVVGGSARWLKLGPLPAIHPAEIAKLALVDLSRPLVRQARHAGPRLLGGDRPVPGHRLRRSSRSCSRSRTSARRWSSR